MTAPRARCDWLAALALLALDLAAYGGLLDPGRMLADYDAFVFFYPLRAYAAAAVQEGRLPLWNPSSFLGVPFIANPQTAFFYPPTALFFWLAVPWAYGLSLVGHMFLAGLFSYGFLRISLALGSPSALLGAAVFMLGGVLAGQYGHLNQFSAVAWLPAILLAADRAVAHGSLRWAGLGGLLLGLQLLAGHPQQSYMTLLVLGWLGLWRAWPTGLRGISRAAGLVGAVGLLGFALAAVQLLPTAELARASPRASGLSYQEALAGALPPWLVARALLPSYANDLGSTELLGYVGVLPLVLAAIGLGTADRRRLSFAGPLALAGLLLALGGSNPLYGLLYSGVPGFAAFRVPARWLLLYTFGTASLAALGLEWLLARCGGPLARATWVRLGSTLALLSLAGLATYLGGVRAERSLQLAWAVLGLAGLALAAGCARPRSRRLTLPVLLIAAGLELWAAGRDLPPRMPVPIDAYAQVRDSTLFIQARLGGARVLSIASEDYELKESPDYREWFSGLPSEALTAFLVAAKRNEILSPNVNLLYRIDDVDGYDGGLLPLQRWLRLAELLVPPERLRSDGALISRLDSLPPLRLMELLNLRLVLAGRSADYGDGSFDYDRSVLVRVGAGEQLSVARVPSRGSTAVGLISWLDGDPVPDGTPVAELELVESGGPGAQVPILAGRETAFGRPGPGSTVPSELQALEPDPSNPGGATEYVAQVPARVERLARVVIRGLRPGTRLNLRALALLDERDEAWTSLVLDDRLERTVFFDTKVYEYPGVLGRAYLVHRATELDDGAALARLAAPDFEPRREAVVAAGSGLGLAGDDTAGETVEILEQQAERVRIAARATAPGLLVLSDPDYPGWKVTVDGAPAAIVRTNLALRGVALPAGEHEVIFSYEPASFRLGALVSAAGLVGLGVLLACGGARRWARTPAAYRPGAGEGQRGR